MKNNNSTRSLMAFLFLICFTLTYAQENTEGQPVNLNEINNKKHEFSIDVLEGLILPAMDISYEYVLSKYSGFGASININFQDEDSSFKQKFAFTPYFRQYFFNRRDYGARGFFAEGLLQYAIGENRNDYDGDIFVTESENGTWNNVGIGVTIGQKWVSRNGFVIELSAGGGRYANSGETSPEGFFRGGVSFGYRF